MTHSIGDNSKTKMYQHQIRDVFCYRRSLLSCCVFFGITICGTVVWQADAGDEKTLKRPPQWSEFSSERSIKRSRAAEHPPPEVDDHQKSPWAATGETWSSGDHVSPTFDESTPKNITTQLGKTPYLHCIVNNLGDKTVSWIRRKDFHVLTVGLDIYTSDERFQAIHNQNTDDWTLQIKISQLRDEGVYECQVSSDPKISYFVNLRVLVARAAIEGAPDLYVKSGSSINLTCVITKSSDPPDFVFWYHDDRMINYDGRGEQIAVLQKGQDTNTAISKLFIAEVDSSHSGNYTCCPSNAESTSIAVHVLNGEKPAAMQHDANPGHSLSGRSPFENRFWIGASLLLLLLWMSPR